MELMAWIALGILVAAFLILAWKYRPWKKEKVEIEFKCLEHMCPIDHWDPVYRVWECPEDGCEVVVDAETRWIYEGVRPPG